MLIFGPAERISMNTRTSQILLLSSPVLLVLVLPPAFVSAQSQSNSGQSVAEAARRAREQKKTAVKPVKVITNDDLKPAIPSSPQQTAASAPTISQGAAAQVPAEQAATTTPSADKAEKEKRATELADLKKQLAAAQSDLDLLQRQLALQRDTYYSNPDYVHDTAGKAQLDQLKQQISDKQQAVEELKTRVAALQELVGTGTTPPSEKPTTPPQS
jgi:predicted RNase H-like nuclease (RuvC/YqgF family)